MAKPKKSASVPNRHLYSRLSYLHQAAAYLGSQVGNHHDSKPGLAAPGHQGDPQGTHSHQPECPTTDRIRLNLARHLLTDLRATSLKSQIRLSPTIKHTICKFCDTLLIESETSSSVIENKSRHGKKPWADVLVVKCNVCGGLKRFPLQGPRQKRRPQRHQPLENVSRDATDKQIMNEESTDVVMNDHGTTSMTLTKPGYP